MGDEPAPAPQPQPAAPDYAAASREAVEADIETLPERRMIEQAARLGKKVTLPDGTVVDFTGMGEAELGREQARINAETAGMTAESILNIQKKYGAEFGAEALKRIEEADPTGMQARRELASKVLEEMRLGSKISPQAERETEQAIRGAQAARGNILGTSAIAKEVLGKYELGEKLKQQRLSNVAAYVMGTPLTAQYQTLSGAQQGTAPYAPVAYQPGTTLTPGIGQAGAQYAASIYGTQAGLYGQQLQYTANTMQENPWLQGLGLATGVGLSAAQIAVCWVAEELWGKADPRVEIIRAFCKKHTPDLGILGRFCSAYQSDGVKWAQIIQDNKYLRGLAQGIWSMLLGMAEYENAGGNINQQIVEAMLPEWLKKIKEV